MALLIIGTLGTYSIYWTFQSFVFIQQRQDKKLPNFAWYLTPTFTFLAVLPTFYLYEDSNAVMGAVVLLLAAAVGVAFWWLWRFCEAFEDVLEGKFSRRKLFLISVALDDFYILFFQNEINKLPKIRKKSKRQFRVRHNKTQKYKQKKSKA